MSRSSKPRAEVLHAPASFPRSSGRRWTAFTGLALLVSACGERDEVYDKGIGKAESFGLTDRVALVDGAADRALVLTARGDEVDRSFVPVGKGITRSLASQDRKRLFVLSAGESPRRKEDDERPSLTIIEAPAEVGAESVVRRFNLESPHTGIAIDPAGRYAAVFAAPTTSGATPVFLENPNEIIILDLAAPNGGAVIARTLRSFGGRPQRLTFTPTLSLPGGPRRLLVVETNQDVVLLDLNHVGDVPPRPEITVRLTSGLSAKALVPAGVVVDDGDPAKTDDARIGVRLENDSSVVTLTLEPRPADPPGAPAPAPGAGALNDFAPTVNLTDVGGLPGDIAFVRTDAGVRLAAIVPPTQSAVLIDPQTSVTTNVALPGRFGRISLITDIVGGAATPGRTDTALLYGGTGGSAGVAFWSLGKASGQPYRSVEVVSLESAVTGVLDVPPPRAELKVLQVATNAVYVLNLSTRTASPLTVQSRASIHVTDDGQRLWAYQPGGPQLAQVVLENIHPVQLPLDRSISAVFEVAKPGGRSLLALDARAAMGVTVLDALSPNTATSRSYYGLLLEGLQ
ncbi:MAG: hypothetical protein IPF92_24575 [Myxococcales bacterium]|jgi:hypothetical protein|nr:hypothetical protein [Myxococcales bacterium]MBL0193515.1 hypothetical protein [Myxococcales bacterium]HQY65359.1 hypothetical protein [Polyangiaceae bacterium]